jgi:hypothetical protein
MVSVELREVALDGVRGADVAQERLGVRGGRDDGGGGWQFCARV